MPSDVMDDNNETIEGRRKSTVRFLSPDIDEGAGSPDNAMGDDDNTSSEDRVVSITASALEGLEACKQVQLTCSTLSCSCYLEDS